jgi:hypothetical protein
VRELLEQLGLACAKSGSESKKLLFDHLDESITATISELRQLTEGGITSKLYTELSEILGRAGWRKRKGLQKELSKLLQVSEATVHRAIKKHAIGPPD